MKLTKKQKASVESLHKEIKDILTETMFLTKENQWNFSQIDIRATYDTFRILNLVQGTLNK